MEKICLIYQPCGLGDILFLQKVCKHYISKGFRIIYPVVYEYFWLSEYIPEIEFISWGDNERKLTHKDKLPDNIEFPYKEYYSPFSNHIFTDNFVYLNFFQQNQGRIMEFKYNSINIEYNDWADYVTFKRNIEKENDLYYNILGLSDDDDYVFVNRNYQMRPSVLSYGKISNNPSFYNKKVVEMSIIEGFTLFDWCKVLEKASSIHMIETSLNYILESNELKNKITSDLNLYHRNNNYNEVRYLFKLNWKYN
jgi:hypothetical protein